MARGKTSAAERLEIGTVCVIDDDGVLLAKRPISLKEIPTYQPKTGELVFPHAVDTAIGRYRWTGKTFLLVSNDPSVKIQSSPDLLHGLMALAKAVRDQGILDPFPPAVSRAIDWYDNTIDGGAPIK